MLEFPPRGSGHPGAAESSAAQTWGHPWKLGREWDWSPGKLILGEWKGELFGDPDQRNGRRKGDDRHVVTAAGSRAGKSTTVLIPNLLRYPGSAIVLDPKGELARATAAHRARVFGHTVAVLDPYGTSGLRSDSYNPFDELDPKANSFIDDVALVADALIIEPEKGDPHWTDSAKTLIRGLILYMFASGGEVSLPRLRRLMLGSEGQLTGKAAPDEGVLSSYLFDTMAMMDDFGGLLSLMGKTFAEKNDRELSSILSTAREQLSFLDSGSLAGVLASSSLRLNKLKVRPTTIYLCLPAARLATHARWMRVIVSMGFAELERDPTTPDLPVLFMLEEFGALGHLRPIERAAGFMAGFGVRLWSILQDFTQLKTHYPRSWETFLGNAGVIQAFGNVDVTTTEHLSKMMGNTRVNEFQDIAVSAATAGRGDLGRREHIRNVKLLEPDEIAHHFARDTNRQLILVPGQTPVYMNRIGING